MTDLLGDNRHQLTSTPPTADLPVDTTREGFPDSDMLAVVKFLVAQGADLTPTHRRRRRHRPRFVT
jgi:hypothetical protein